MKSFRTWWMVYAACSLTLLAVTAWISMSVLRLEQRELKLAALSGLQEDLRLALWRMDSSAEALLAVEGARPFFHYRAYYPHQRAYTRLLEAFGPNDLLVPSPLLEHESSVVRLHFQRSADGGWSSPEVPVGNLRDLAESTGVAGKRIDEQARRLLGIQAAMEMESTLALTMKKPADDALGASLDGDQPDRLNFDQTGAYSEAADSVAQPIDPRSLKEQQARSRSSDNWQAIAQQVTAQQSMSLARDVSNVEVSTFTPRWVGTTAPALLFVRNVLVADEAIQQGFAIDFTVLSNQLLNEIEDLFPNATLRPIVASSSLRGDAPSRRLATIPAVLEVNRVAAPLQAGLTPLRSALLVAWLAVIAVITAVGLTLRSIIGNAQRRMRFASAVTHELRSPLTTFQLYSELLDEGLVDADTQRDYFRTLRRESARLGRLVENVLAYARLEDGRHVTKRREIEISDLVDQISAAAQLRAKDHCLEVIFDGGLGHAVDTSPEVLEQIIGNLIDNAVKYGVDPIQLTVRCISGRLIFEVADAGSGIPTAMADRIFDPFDRGARDGGDPTAGVGLGLALSRELARDIGSDLILADPKHAVFQLSMPLVSGPVEPQHS